MKTYPSCSSRACVLLAVLGLVACGGKSSSPTAPSPQIPQTYALSGTVTTATTGNAIAGATVKILDGPNANKTTISSTSGAYTLPGLQPSGFTFTVSATGHQPKSQGLTLTGNQTVNVQLSPVPTVVSFTADSTSVTPGSSTVLRWEVKDAESCHIQPDTEVGSVPCTGQFTIKPTRATSTYAIWARNAAGEVSKGLTVTVLYPAVQYRVSGTATRADVTLATSSGGTAQYSSVRTPWTYDMSYASSGLFLYISAQNDTSAGCVTVEIFKRGTSYKSTTSCGAWVIATASGSY